MIKLTYRPNPKQTEFLQARDRYLAYGGARGGGKSWAVQVKAILMALQYPGIAILIVRKTYKELQVNHIDKLRKELGKLGKLVAYNSTEKRFRFRNGSTIEFSYCASDGDLSHFQGAEWQIIMIDEATNLREEWIKQIIACNRGVDKYPRQMIYTMNPGGVSHGYFKRLFIDRDFKADENPAEYRFIQALVTDNYALMRSQPEYKKQLEVLPSKLKKAWLDGRWDLFDGQFFEEFVDDPAHYEDRLRTHVIAPFTPRPGWTYFRSFDWGYSKPFSCAWWCIDYDGILYRIIELYGCQDEPNTGVKQTPAEVFAQIHEVETTHPWLAGRKIIGVADPAIWDAETGESIADTAAKHQVYFSKGDHKRIPGWMQCHYRLMFDEDGRPGMYVFSTCKAFIRTIPLLEYDEHRVEDIDTSQEDHVADEWRYMCMMRPIHPVPEEIPTVQLTDPLEQVHGRRY